LGLYQTKNNAAFKEENSHCLKFKTHNMGSIVNRIEDAIQDIKDGKFVIVTDDEDRENEGDFICAAEKITPEMVNFMITHGRGVVCAALTEERCEELDLGMQVGNNTSIHSTPFTVSVDKLEGCTTGVSTADRAATFQALADSSSTPETFGRPGHIFPLRACSKGVLRRAGHTEAAVDLARLAGLNPAGALIEIMNEDGTMARFPQLEEIAKKFNLKLITIKDLIAYRLQSESLVERGVKVDMPTAYGHFKLIPFRQLSNDKEHVALIKGEWEKDEPILVRVHSSCATGDIFGSMRCECGEQLHKAMELIEAEGKGVIVYMNQEGRGIGLMNKIKAYKLQEEGLDTVDANLHLGFNADERDYGVGAQILREIGVSKIKLMSNNPVKRIGLEAYGLSIVSNVAIEVNPNKYNEFYMQTKKLRMGHDLKYVDGDSI
jgi:3,4-dihydroxy 2-butanone 4-phosphate synthase / GTP cyclohydrolase II